MANVLISHNHEKQRFRPASFCHPTSHHLTSLGPGANLVKSGAHPIGSWGSPIWSWGSPIWSWGPPHCALGPAPLCPGARPIGSWSSSCWALGPITFESWDQCRWVLKPAPLGPVAHPIDIHAGSRFVFRFLFFCVALRSRPRTVQGRLHHTGASQAESKAATRPPRR